MDSNENGPSPELSFFFQILLAVLLCLGYRDINASAELMFFFFFSVLVVFDNQRILHGRSGFTGSRRLCGGYINGDDYRSRLRALEHQFRQKPLNTSPDDVWNDID